MLVEQQHDWDKSCRSVFCVLSTLIRIRFGMKICRGSQVLALTSFTWPVFCVSNTLNRFSITTSALHLGRTKSKAYLQWFSFTLERVERPVRSVGSCWSGPRGSRSWRSSTGSSPRAPWTGVAETRNVSQQLFLRSPKFVHTCFFAGFSAFFSSFFAFFLSSWPSSGLKRAMEDMKSLKKVGQTRKRWIQVNFKSGGMSSSLVGFCFCFRFFVFFSWLDISHRES